MLYFQFIDPDPPSERYYPSQRSSVPSQGSYRKVSLDELAPKEKKAAKARKFLFVV